MKASTREEKVFIDAIYKSVKLHYPTPYWDRMYKFPKGYMQPEEVKKSIAFKLGLPSLSNDDWPGMAIYYAMARKMLENQFPLYLLTRPLTKMIASTEWPADSSIYNDARPPYDAGTFVLPASMLGDSDGGCAKYISWAIINGSEARKYHSSLGGELEDIHLLISCDMGNDLEYFGNYRIKEDGSITIDNGEFISASEYGVEGSTKVKCEIIIEKDSKFIEAIARFIMTVFIYLNIDKKEAILDEVKVKTIGKGSMPKRDVMKPAIIGLSLKPTGYATHGTHASPETHLRRRHMKWVRFGPRHSERRRQWIEATIVNKNK